jgi:hypothetical protein
MESGSKCQSCGTAAWEWEEDRYAYEPVTVRCHGCYLKEAARDDQPMPGSRITLVPKQRAHALRERAGVR